MNLGEKGEIIMKAPQLMMGYWNSPEITAETIRNGWLHTGDVGYMDEDGYIFIIERKKDMIKAGGYAVWPREVEEVIASGAHGIAVVSAVSCAKDPGAATHELKERLRLALEARPSGTEP